ncbi:aminotransferase class I/II-fold pyridoxal phosphate-dependent enzyme [Hanstruepera ponticola]|uniref:aminotransferase class I/II-fold pyridoxal phosphate-dependent enzyme n=1 Tax=Hanstruepera ponticola TaxID=2042995 RepID=UPI0017826592|nr:aminotransferase class I/II-fold pyridoxal phosphate-dependent enzyme [Hanstruepera ponticola]
MKTFPKRLTEKLKKREEEHALRQLNNQDQLVDFSSNDYLGFSKNENIFNETHDYLVGHNIKHNGATGSRLLSGNHNLYHLVETVLCEFHQSEAALVFNSGYDANIGFFSCVPQRHDIILYDEYVHASIRDGISMSHANAFKFGHNDLSELDTLLKKYSDSVIDSSISIYVVTESVFSMDGDSPHLETLAQLCTNYHAHLIIDEAHAVGVFGDQGKGIVQKLELERQVFARIITFGKALGAHGAAILGSSQLKSYLINFSRSLIYTTALPPHALATINASYLELIKTDATKKLHENINHFITEVKNHDLETYFIPSNSAIHCAIIPGNETIKQIAHEIREKGFNIKPILSPTVPNGQERLRFCIHSYNSKQEISEVLKVFATFARV